MARQIDRSQWIRVGAAAALLVAAVVIFFNNSNSTRRDVVNAYFLNLETDALIVSDSLTSPVTLNSGAEAVRAHVFSCSQCDNEDQRTLAYVEKRIPIDATSDGDPPDIGLRLSDDRGKTWHAMDTQAGQAILARTDVRNACPPGKNFITCMP